MECPSRASSTMATWRTSILMAWLTETVCRAVLSVFSTMTPDPSADMVSSCLLAAAEGPDQGAGLL